MLINIAICDDEINELDKVQKMLEKYLKEEPNNSFQIKTFTSIEIMLNSISNGNRFDILLLDVFMNGETGIEGARWLRNRNYDGEIIFISNSTELGYLAYEVDAINYIIKPIDYQKLAMSLHKAVANVFENINRNIIVKTSEATVSINVSTILYAESQGNYLYLYNIKNDSLRIRKTIKSMIEELERWEEFITVGAIYIVNLDHIKQVTKEYVVLKNELLIKIPRDSYSKIKDKYINYYWREDEDVWSL